MFVLAHLSMPLPTLCALELLLLLQALCVYFCNPKSNSLSLSLSLHPMLSLCLSQFLSRTLAGVTAGIEHRAREHHFSSVVSKQAGAMATAARRAIGRAASSKLSRLLCSNPSRQTQTRSFWAYNSASPVNSSGHVEWDYRGQRRALPVHNIVPYIAVDAYVAPNAVIAGVVDVFDGSSVWYGSVVRGDLNKITINFASNVQDKCVIHAAKTSPTGLPAETDIGKYVTVGAFSTLRSCVIEDEVIIGQRCVLMEGSLVETNAILESGSVLAPGRRIPAGELWGGNPARFIRQLTYDEVHSIKLLAEKMRNVAKMHACEFLPYSTAYLEAEKLKKSLLLPA